MSNSEIEKAVSQYTQNPYTMKIEKVAAYVRVSTQEQKLHGLSLDAQKMKLIEYAEKNHMKIVEWYLDEGVSGRKLIKNRPELQRMIQDAEKGNFDRIIFIKLDRFFRSVAEYHECMKRISPVIWSTTEEEYDLTTANGRMLVNMKLTIAEMEADQTGERIRIVNEYKVQTGQPLTGSQSQPFGFTVVTDKKTGRKAVVKNPDEAEILEDVIAHYITFQNRRKTLIYMHSKYHVAMSYNSLSLLFKNTMLYGAYRDNPTYCEPYITKEQFDRIQEIMSRNGKKNTAQNREYLFGGLIKCPCCSRLLTGGTSVNRHKDKVTRYKKYRCSQWRTAKSCEFNKAISEKSFERLMLANIEKYFEEAKLRAAKVTDSGAVKLPEFDVDEIHAEIDRLNYSWKTGKIRKVEQYEKDYEELMLKLEAAEAEQEKIPVKDFSKVEKVLQEGWKGIYSNLDEAHRKAFWRSFIRSIEINWTTEKKEVTRVNFF